MTNNDSKIQFSLDKRRVNLKGGWSDNFLNEIKKTAPEIIALHDGDWNDSRFLQQLECAYKGLQVNNQTVDWGVVSQLSKLERLEVAGWFYANLNFSKMDSLKFLKTYWNDGYQDFSGLPQLEVLSLRGWKENDVQQLSGFKKLEFLQLLECKRITELCGLQDLPQLRGINLYSLPKLSDISALFNVGSLESAVFENCKKIKSFAPLSGAKKLKQFIVAKSSNIESLDFLRGMKNLSHVAFGNGTAVLDGDMSPLLELPNLKYCRFTNNKNYSHTQEGILSLVGIKNDPSVLASIWDQPSINL